MTHVHPGWFFPFGGLFLVLLACFLVALVFRFSRRGACERARPNALAALDERLARGEITVDEHARVKTVLDR